MTLLQIRHFCYEHVVMNMTRTLGLFHEGMTDFSD
jgi:hypothetical protein